MALIKTFEVIIFFKMTKGDNKAHTIKTSHFGELISCDETPIIQFKIGDIERIYKMFF